MRRVTNTHLLFWVHLTEHFLQGNVPLNHLLNAKPPFMYWQRSAFNEVNNWAPNVFIFYLGNLNGIEDEETIDKLVNGLILPGKFHSIGYPVLITTALVIFSVLVFCSIRDRHYLKIRVPQTDGDIEHWITDDIFPQNNENVSQIKMQIINLIKLMFC